MKSASKVEVCKLCLKEAELRNSHIIPEFIHEQLYDSKHRAFQLSNKLEKPRLMQKGEREQLLCMECETKLSRWENYAQKLLYDRESLPVVETKHAEYISYSRVEYSEFKLFQLSLLWRASVSTLDFFSSVKLGPHEERIRLMLMDENPGKDWEYCCSLTAIIHEGELYEGMTSPMRLRTPDEGHIFYRFLIAGYYWSFIVSSHEKQSRFRKFCLTEQGVVPVFQEQAKDLEFFQLMGTYFRERLPDVKKLNL